MLSYDTIRFCEKNIGNLCYRSFDLDCGYILKIINYVYTCNLCYEEICKIIGFYLQTLKSSRASDYLKHIESLYFHLYSTYSYSNPLYCRRHQEGENFYTI